MEGTLCRLMATFLCVRYLDKSSGERKRKASGGEFLENMGERDSNVLDRWTTALEWGFRFCLAQTEVLCSRHCKGGREEIESDFINGRGIHLGKLSVEKGKLA